MRPQKYKIDDIINNWKIIDVIEGVGPGGRGRYVSVCGKCNCTKIRTAQTLKDGCMCSAIRPSAAFHREPHLGKRYSEYKGKCKQKNQIFDISKERFKELVNGNCFYCNREAKKDNLNGIDRINSSLQYIEGNMVSCCSQCNYAKSNYTQTEFLDWIKRVYTHLLGENHATQD